MERNRNIHTKYTTHKVQWDKYRREERDLAKHSVGVGALRDAVNGQSSEVVAVGAREDLFEVTQVRGHSDDVILDVTKIHADVHAGSNLVILVAALREAAENVGFAAQETEKSHTVLSRLADRSKEGTGVIIAHDEYVVLDGISLKLELANGRSERIDDVVTK